MTPAGNLSWHTFLGGVSHDGVSEIVMNANGDIYVGGTSYSTWGNPVLPYSGGSWNAFVAKLDPSGALTWNTFLGAGRDEGQGIAIDRNDNVYIVGNSFHTWGNPVRAFESSVPFPMNGFAAKLNSTGDLIWNTFLGTGNTDESDGVSIDDVGQVYVVGTSCTSWGNPFRATSGCSDTFIAKLDGSGNLLTNGFIGGTGSDYGARVYVNGEGNAYMLGTSEEGWGNPVRSFKKDFNDSTIDRDGFVARLNLDTTQPTVSSITRASNNPTSAASVDFTVTFSEDVASVSSVAPFDDFALNTSSGINGASITGVSGSGKTYTVTVSTGSGSGTIRLDMPVTATITDLGGNTLSGLPFSNGETYTMLSSRNKPDLIITNVTLIPAIPIPNQAFDVSITIKNQGNADAIGVIYRDVYIDRDPSKIRDPETGCPPPGEFFRSDVYTSLAPLAPGMSDTKKVTITGGLSGSLHKIWAYVDSRCLIDEK
jgi:hypothetical protein